MIRVQRLKQPKNTSGKELKSGASVIVDKIKIVNQGASTVYVDQYTRKRYPVKKTAKKK